MFDVTWELTGRDVIIYKMPPGSCFGVGLPDVTPGATRNGIIADCGKGSFKHHPRS